MLFMQSPRSFTREDVVEFHCHGGIAVIQQILRRCVELGARLARPGEFTLRAFLNGRIDLTEAEAVAELISARSSEAARLAVGGWRANWRVKCANCDPFALTCWPNWKLGWILKTTCRRSIPGRCALVSNRPWSVPAN